MMPLVDKRVWELGGGKRGLSDVTNSPLRPSPSDKAPMHWTKSQWSERDPCVRRLQLGGSPAGQVIQDENDDPASSQQASPHKLQAAHGSINSRPGKLDAALSRQHGSRLSLKRGRSLISGPPARVQHDRAPLSPLVRFSVSEEQPTKRQNIDGVPTPHVVPLVVLQEADAVMPPEPQSRSGVLVASPAEQIDEPDAAHQPQHSPAAAEAAEPVKSAAAPAVAAVAAAQDISKVTMRRRRRVVTRPPPSPTLPCATLDRRVSFAGALSVTPAALPCRSQLSVTAYHSQ
jgi:hypothetical protein